MEIIMQIEKKEIIDIGGWVRVLRKTYQLQSKSNCECQDTK
jgi:hypothetical protein